MAKSTKKQIDWVTTSFLLGYHIALLVALPIYFLKGFAPSAKLLVVTGALAFICNLSITAGYHRLYSHTSYRVRSFFEPILLFFATLATQGSALRWSYDHRIHHAFVDKDRDPYCINKGFFYAHMKWLFYVFEPINPKVISDLLRSKMLVFQDKYFGVLMFVSNFLVSMAVGKWTGDYFGSFLFAWGVRLFFCHHTTWFINSLAHTWGSKTFSQEHTAVDNFVISLLTCGEGYHNYHHTFGNDYRNGVHWYQFDPTKWFIWTLSKLGLADKLVKISDIRIQEKIVQAGRKELIEKLSGKYHEVEAAVKERSDALLAKLKELREKTKEYTKSQGDRTMKSELKRARAAIKREYLYWRRFYRDVDRMKMANA